MTHLGRMLVLYRASRGEGQQEVADAVGFSKATLCRFERGKALDAENFLKLMTWLVADRQPEDATR